MRKDVKKLKRKRKCKKAAPRNSAVFSKKNNPKENGKKIQKKFKKSSTITKKNTKCKHPPVCVFFVIVELCDAKMGSQWEYANRKMQIKFGGGKPHFRQN